MIDSDWERLGEKVSGKACAWLREVAESSGCRRSEIRRMGDHTRRVTDGDLAGEEKRGFTGTPVYKTKAKECDGDSGPVGV